MPVLVRVKVCGLVNPATTLLKVRLVALAASVPDEVEPGFDVGVPAPVNPTQPASDITARHVRIKANMPSGARRLRITWELRIFV